MLFVVISVVWLYFASTLDHWRFFLLANQLSFGRHKRCKGRVKNSFESLRELKIIAICFSLSILKFKERSLVVTLILSWVDKREIIRKEERTKKKNVCSLIGAARSIFCVLLIVLLQSIVESRRKIKCEIKIIREKKSGRRDFQWKLWNFRLMSF